MKKSLKLFQAPLALASLVLLFILVPLQETTAQTYCFPTYSPQGDSWRITQFSIPEVSYSINIASWNQTDNTSEIIAVSAGLVYTFQITTAGWVGVGVAVDLNNDGDFDDPGEILQAPTYIADNPANYSYSITIPAGLADGVYRLRLWNALANSGNGTPAGSPCGAYSYGTYADFTLLVGDCLPPGGVQFSNVMQNSATVDWDDNTDVDYWNLEYGESGFSPGNGTLISNINVNFQDLTGLMSGTEYDVYLQAQCDTQTASIWVGPISFSTLINSEPIEITGFNADVIANGVGPMSSSTTNDVDGGNYCFLSEDWKLNAGSPNLTVGLPDDGIISSLDIEGLNYQMSPFLQPYDGDNSLRIESNNNPEILELVTPASYLSLYFLATTGGGSSNVEIVVHFDDNTSQVFPSNTIPDWFGVGLPIEASGFGRGNMTNDNVETPSNNPKLFRIAVDIDMINQDKLITEVTFTKTGGGIANIFAISGKIADEPVCEAPVNFSIDDIGTETILISWDEPADTDNIDGYGWVVVLPGDTPFVDDHVSEGMVNVGVTTAVVADLDPDTDYDIYFLSICDLNEMWFSDFLMASFSTETLGINDISFSGFSFYPNPIDNSLYLQATEALQEVQIYNLLGQELISMKNSNSSTFMSIDLEGVSAGVYMMKVTISGTTKAFKVVKK